MHEIFYFVFDLLESVIQCKRKSCVTGEVFSHLYSYV